MYNKSDSLNKKRLSLREDLAISSVGKEESGLEPQIPKFTDSSLVMLLWLEFPGGQHDNWSGDLVSAPERILKAQGGRMDKNENYKSAPLGGGTSALLDITCP